MQAALADKKKEIFDEDLVALVDGRSERFIVFCDDLSFDEGEPGYKALKSMLDGSISAAGRAMDMSYKRAWDLVDEINRICRQAAVERQTGGKNGGGAVLTPFGQSLVARYRKIERDAASAVRKDLEALRSDIGKPKKAAGR